MRLFFLNCLIIVYISSDSRAQNMNYTRSVIDTLTSSYMSGRGYVNNGHQKAAKYIKNQFDSIGLKPIESEFYQAFKFPINTFPAKINLTIDNQTLIPGKDFLIEPNAPGTIGNYKLAYVDSLIISDKKARKKFFQKKCKDSFLVIDLKIVEGAQNKTLLDSLKANFIGAKGLIFLESKKLTWHLAQEVDAFPSITILKSAFPQNAKCISIAFQNKHVENFSSQNIIAYVKGKQQPDSFVVFTAHYDHLGMMGDSIYFPGANDNASGISMLLNLANYYATHPQNFSMAFIAFGAEEVGLLGSKHFTEYPLFPLGNIKFLLNMDLLGTGDEGLMVVNGKVYTALFDSLISINAKNHYLSEIKSRGKVANSDHYWFTEKGVKSFFIYTLGGISAYHDINDRAETLPLTKYTEVYKLIIEFIDSIQ